MFQKVTNLKTKMNNKKDALSKVKPDKASNFILCIWLTSVR